MDVSTVHYVKVDNATALSIGNPAPQREFYLFRTTSEVSLLSNKKLAALIMKIDSYTFASGIREGSDTANALKDQIEKIEREMNLVWLKEEAEIEVALKALSAS
ncbi:MAG: hypothetical protein MRY21_01585 [Simkaniaceae bacterium]|nr:hypothetical protein [Simkaniaceae bacterium]